MQKLEHFLLTPGVWEGQGVIRFSMSPESIPFVVTWTVESIEENRLRAVQKVTLSEDAQTTNTMSILIQEEGRFDIFIENEEIGSHQGSGFFDSSTVRWEYQHPGQLEGVEIYERKEHVYKFSSTYDGGDGFKTLIEGELQRLLPIV